LFRYELYAARVVTSRCLWGSHAHRPAPDSCQVPFPRAIRSRASRFFRSASVVQDWVTKAHAEGLSPRSIKKYHVGTYSSRREALRVRNIALRQPSDPGGHGPSKLDLFVPNQARCAEGVNG
jgi:hypothetical protein